jgi:hypothetical protein
VCWSRCIENGTGFIRRSDQSRPAALPEATVGAEFAEHAVFTIIAFFGLAVIAWHLMRKQTKEAAHQPGDFDNDRVKESVVHARQELRLMAYLFGGILIMLGIIADRIH